MNLIPDWKLIARKAWSVRLMAIASILSGCEAVLPYAEFMLPRGSFALLSFVIVTLALLARFVAQRDIQDASKEKDEGVI
ncbi:MAG: hypothetical protein KAX66_05195 [Propionivibrio sp.]|nr:hypothetical protein [Propionivibrio sp.]